MTDATVYAVASGKGGVGKTTTAVNLGAGFANAGHSAVVVDLDLGMANLGDFLEATPAGPTLHDVLAGEATLDDALSHAEPGLDVILGSEDLSDFGKADPTKFREFLVDLRDRYDVVILDSGGGLSHDSALPLGLADSVILVSTVEEPAVQNTAKTLELTEQIDGRVTGVILTRSGGGKEADPTAIASRLGLRLIGTVPEDSTVVDSAKAGETLLSYDADSPAAQAYHEIVYDLLDEPLPMNLGGDATTGSIPDAVEREGDPGVGIDDATVAGGEEPADAVSAAESSIDEQDAPPESGAMDTGEEDEVRTGETDVDGAVTIGDTDEAGAKTAEEADDTGDGTPVEVDETEGEMTEPTVRNGEETTGDAEAGAADDEQVGTPEQTAGDESEQVDTAEQTAGDESEQVDTAEQTAGDDSEQEQPARSLLSWLTGGLFG